MLNINEIRNLEEKWKKYKRKKYIKIVLYIFLLVIIISIAVLYYIGFIDKVFDRYIHKDQKIEKIKKATKAELPKETIKKEKTKNQKVSEKPLKAEKVDVNHSDKNDTNMTKETSMVEDSMKTVDNEKQKNIVKSSNSTMFPNSNEMLQLNTNFLNHIYSKTTDKNLSKATVEQNINQNHPVTKEINDTESNISKTNKTTPEKIISKSKKPKIIISSKKIDKLKYLKERYNETGRSMYAIMISKEYYRKKMYKESLIWATMANSIDSTSEESWIMFAKSKVKLNQKNDAINALRAYLKVNSSKRIKILLTNITNGVFK